MDGMLAAVFIMCFRLDDLGLELNYLIVILIATRPDLKFTKLSFRNLAELRYCCPVVLTYTKEIVHLRRRKAEIRK
jgi:hypothetical protein